VDDRRIDAKARIATACAVLSVLVFTSPVVGIYFGAMGSIYTLSCLIDESAGCRTRRVALVAGSISLLAILVGVIALITAPPAVYGGE
jgi:hypothetical protein